MMNRINRIVPKPMQLPLVLVLVWNGLAYFCTRLVNSGLHHHDLSLPLDGSIPLIPWTVSIYLVCYGFWVVNYILAAHQDPEEAWQFFAGEFLAKMVCLVCFLLLPTAIARPEITGTDFWSRLLSLVYLLDSPDNLFPSIHCLVSWFCCIAVRKNPKIPRWYKGFSLVFTLLVCISTLTTRQHVIVDTFSGVLLAEAAYRIAGRTGLARFYRRALSRFQKEKE